MRYLIMAFFILCSLVFAQSNIDEDSIHFIGQASAFTVGSELVTDGGFPSFDNWTQGTWTLATGVASEDNAGANSDLTQTLTGLTDGRVYRIQFEVTAYTDGNVAARFDNVELGDKTSTGVFTGYAVAIGTAANVTIRADATFTGSVDNVKVVAWTGDLDASGGCTIDNFTGTLTDYMEPDGGVLHHDTSLAISDSGVNVIITAATTWDTTPKIGGFVNVNFEAGPIGSGVDDGVFVILDAFASYIIINTAYTAGDNGNSAEVWIGGAYPDIATAINDSTLSQDPGGGTGTYRKRYICVNVPMEVDAVTDFVAENSETALREDDGSRKLIGFYDSISVVQPDAGYRVVSDMDEGQTYYAGARKAFNQDEGFPVINPNGKWIEWNAKGNDFGATGILVLGTSNFEMRNIKIHNTIADAGDEGLIHTDTAHFNTTFTNCWFDTSSNWQVNDAPVSLGNSIVDCFFGDGIDIVSLSDWQSSSFSKSIFSGNSRGFNISGVYACTIDSCLIYKSGTGLIASTSISLFNNIFFDQTERCIYFSAAEQNLKMYYNNIFSPIASSDFAISVNFGSFSPAGFNNIMYSVTGGGVLTTPINHNQITPNPALPVGTLEVDPLFVNPAQGDFRLRASSPALNAAYGGGSIGYWQPYALPRQGARPRYSGSPLYGSR